VKIGDNVLFHLALTGVLTTLWMLDLGTSRIAAVTAGFAFATSGFVISAINLTISLCSIAYFPLILLCWRRTLTEKGLRWRIEHAQHFRNQDIPRFAKLGVIASMQPYHAIDDGCWADKVIGAQRAKGTYAFRSLLDARARVTFGSDWFVAPPSVVDGLYAAVTRVTLDDRHPGGWVPEQKISVEEALRSYTAEGAYASFEEKEKGRLEVGMLADLVMLDCDLLRIKPHELRQARVLLTVVAGRVVHEQK